MRAVEIVRDHYSGLGYTINSVEKDNVGWDLEAVFESRKLIIEVKGLSGEDLRVGLTPNEYKAMREKQIVYRLCVVRMALTKPALSIFSFAPEIGCFQSSDGSRLNVVEMVGAVCSVTCFEPGGQPK